MSSAQTPLLPREQRFVELRLSWSELRLLFNAYSFTGAVIHEDAEAMSISLCTFERVFYEGGPKAYNDLMTKLMALAKAAFPDGKYKVTDRSGEHPE